MVTEWVSSKLNMAEKWLNNLKSLEESAINISGIHDMARGKLETHRDDNTASSWPALEGMKVERAFSQNLYR